MHEDPQRPKNPRHSIREEVTKFRQELRWHHKIIYGFLVFLGISLLWYGMWGIVEMIPFLRHPFVAAALGVLILSFTGLLYQKLIGSSDEV